MQDCERYVYDGHTIEIERGGLGWNFAVLTPDKSLVAEGVGWEFKKDALDEAKFIIDHPEERE